MHVVAAKYGEEWGDHRFYSLMKIALLVYVIIIIIIFYGSHDLRWNMGGSWEPSLFFEAAFNDTVAIYERPFF